MTTHVLNVLDASGSMSKFAEDVRGGYNGLLNSLAAAGGDYSVTTTIFDGQIRLLCQAVPLARAPRLDEDTYQPFGTTALLAAVVITIEQFEERVPQLPEGDRVKMVIHTDGFENASFAIHPRFTWQLASSMLAERERRGWSIDYVGAGRDAWDQGFKMGLASASVHHTSASTVGLRSAYDAVTAGTIAYSKGASAAEVSGLIASNLPDDEPEPFIHNGPCDPDDCETCRRIRKQ